MLSLDYIVQTKSKGYLERSLRSFNLWTICISWIDTPAKGHRSYFQSLQTLQIPNINAMLDVFIPYRNECSAVLCLIQIQQSVTIGVQNLISAVLSLRRKRSSSFSGTPSSSYLRLDTYVRSHIYVWTESGIIDPLVSIRLGKKFWNKKIKKHNNFLSGFSAPSNHCTVAWVTPECPKAVKDIVKQAQSQPKGLLPRSRAPEGPLDF